MLIGCFDQNNLKTLLKQKWCFFKAQSKKSVHNEDKTIERNIANNESGSWDLTWSIKSQPENKLDKIVVSEIGEHWSPKIVPPMTAPKQIFVKVGAGLRQ